MSDIHDLSKDELRERTMEKFGVMVHYVTTESLEVFTLRMQVSYDSYRVRADKVAYWYCRSIFLDQIRCQLRSVH